MPVDVNELVAGMAGMLRRTLGEQIQVEFAPGAGLPPALADPAHLETALLNLALNARDAMAQGGLLTIETAAACLDDDYAAREVDVSPGAYVMLVVSDTGSGMTREVQLRACEPFFTTKDVGKGSGLGLAMVYGFVKQSAGHLKIRSELGQGTSVRLYLPASDAPLEPVAAAPVQQLQPTGRETILVVEDEDDVRALVCRLLGGLGYRVLQCADGKSALTILRQEPAIDLLLTDVALPGGVNGPELACAASDLRRDIKVLYTSGYAGNAAAQLDATLTEVRLISKPYRVEELARKIRNALDGTPD
jgi:CheY-like chemotaxis protein